VKSSNSDWRDFEQMVARIEESLAPKGAVVKSPDKIRDLVSGRLREVDASIRFRVGSTPLLITIECRKRKGVQDDTWIEQLATKRGKIGAAKTIAVSSKGFSSSAITTAKLYGIELRSLTDRIEEEIVQQFLSGLKFSFIVTEYRTHSIAFELEGGASLPEAEFGEHLASAIAEGVQGVIAREVGTNKVLTIDSILRLAPDNDLPDDGSIVRKTVVAKVPPRTILVSTKQGPKFLSGVQVIADFTQRVVPAPATNVYEYASPESPIRHTVETVAQISDTEALRMSVDISSPTLEKRTEASGRRTKRAK